MNTAMRCSQMKIIGTLSAALVAAACLRAGPAAATVVVATYTGTVGNVTKYTTLYDPIIGNVQAGDRFMAVFTYNSEVNPAGLSIYADRQLSQHQGSAPDTPVTASLTFSGALISLPDYGLSSRRNNLGGPYFFDRYDDILHSAQSQSGTGLSTVYFDLRTEVLSISENFVTSLDHTSLIDYSVVTGRANGLGSFRIYKYDASPFGIARRTFVDMELGVDHLTIAAAPSSTAVPEPATWAIMIAGFGLTGAVLRRRARALVSCV